MNDLTLNLTTQQEYLSSLALIRQRITIGRSQNDLPSALRLLVHLPYGDVELFLQTSNLYLIGFRGKNKVYALRGESDDPAAVIRNSGRLNPGEEVRPINQRGDHGSLGTFQRAFDFRDLANSSILALYVDGAEYAMIRRPFALLVCMLCEGARFLQVQNEFAGVGYTPGHYMPGPQPGAGLWGSSVDANEVVNYWSNATRARFVAERHGVGVTEGNKHARSLKSELDRMESVLSPIGVPFTRSMLCGWIAGQSQPILAAYEALPSIAPGLQSARETARNLRLTSAASVADFVAALQNDIAVQASRGLLLPAV